MTIRRSVSTRPQSEEPVSLAERASSAGDLQIETTRSTQNLIERRDRHSGALQWHQSTGHVFFGLADTDAERDQRLERTVVRRPLRETGLLGSARRDLRGGVRELLSPLGTITTGQRL